MENGPQITETPSIAASTNSPSASFNVGVEDALSNAVTLTVARSEATIAGHVIFTFAKKGPLTCHDLLKCESTFALLSKLEAEGAHLSEPALLATVDEDGTARSVYITPKPDPQFRDYAVWVGMVNETITQLKAKQVGFYLCKDSLEPEALSDLASQAVRSLIEARSVRDICLIVGRHAYNEVLSTALTLKQELDSTQASVHVLH